jgi:thiamine biosynthesis lipoprotein
VSGRGRGCPRPGSAAGRPRPGRALPPRGCLTRRGLLRLGAGACCSLVAGGAAAALAGCSAAAGPARGMSQSTFFAFDTIVDLRAYCTQAMLDLARDRCSYFEGILDARAEGTDVWRINHAGGQEVEVAQETADVIERSLAYSEASGGLFDVTIGSVSLLWDFDEGVRPEDAAIEAAVSHVGWQGVSVSGRKVRLADPEAMVDLGGIAKGYIADDLASLLSEHGVTSGILNLGGNVYALGSKPSGEAWRVGVRDPNARSGDGSDGSGSGDGSGDSGSDDGSSSQEVSAYVECSGRSVVTSGLYERRFEKDGVAYWHILDPRTGMPAQSDLVSSSILSERSVDGDAYATILFLLGRDAALSLAEAEPAIEGALLEGADGTVTTTPGSGFVVL